MSIHRISIIAGLALLMVVVGVGCFWQDDEEPSQSPATTPAATSTITATAETSINGTVPWLKIVASGETQTREGLSITLKGVAIGTVEKVLADIDTSAAELGNDWTDAKAVIGVLFEVHNPTASTITVPIYTNSKVVANDQQAGIDFFLSDVEVSILSGVRKDMQVVAPIGRYSAEEIRSVRFVLEMSVFASPEGVFDFAVNIP